MSRELASEPVYDAWEMDTVPCTIIIPVYNEEKIVRQNTLALLEFMRDKRIACEIILGSNGSTDATPALIERLAADLPNVKSFHLDRRGAGLAFIRGVEMASHEFIVSVDMDLADDLEFIPLALRLLQDFEMVIGCKHLRSQHRPFMRQLGSNVFIFSAATLLGVAAADFSLSSKAYRRQFVLDHVDRLDHGTAYVLELVYFASQLGYRVVEVSVSCSDYRLSRFNLLAEAGHKFTHLFRFAWIHRGELRA